MDNSTIEILVEMQKTEPTGTEERSCRKVSFAALVLHKHCYLTFHVSQKNFVLAKNLLFSGAGLRHSTRFLTTERKFTTLILRGATRKQRLKS